MKTLHIVIIEGFCRGSHKRWALDIQNFSQHKISLLSLPGRHWKWRMHGAAITLANKFQQLNEDVDVIMCSDMIDVSLFKSLVSSQIQKTPILVYFHENQLTYPWSTSDPDPGLRRDNHYGFINYTSALVADQVYFNSNYHLNSFNAALKPFLNQFPDYQNKETITDIHDKSHVLPLGFDFSKLKPTSTLQHRSTKIILWNHRWEYDKNPKLFFDVLYKLKNEGLEFQLIIAGESTSKKLPVFETAKVRLEKEIIHFGYCENRTTYNELLLKADILPVTSNQDFFGMSVVEAIGAEVFPLLPDRLAYPEHIPEQHKASMLYKDDEDLYLKLKSLLLSEIPKIDYSWIRRYDWSLIADQYDSVFSQEFKL